MHKIDYSDKRLVGSSLLFKADNWIGKIIMFAGFLDWKRGFKKDKYSHIGTIVMQDDGRLGIVEALFNGVVINDLKERICTTKDSLTLCILNNKSFLLYMLHRQAFNKCIKDNIGKDYNAIGAINSGIDIIPDKWHWFKPKKKIMHCSYLDTIFKQSIRIVNKDINATEMTPTDSYYVDVYNKKVIIK